MKLKVTIKNILNIIKNLETIEQKSFWAVAPVIIIAGFISILTTSRAYGSGLAIASASLCILIPLLMILLCFRTKNYHVCYPLLCILLAGLCIPITFLANGGFDSGMPIFCSISTVLCAFCYDKNWRKFSFFLSLLINLLVFNFAKGGFESIYPVKDSWIENDIIFSYLMATFGLFCIINVILDEAKSYARGNEILSRYVDHTVSKELIFQANHGMISKNGTNQKATVLFADISRFTSTTENMKPEIVANYLNIYFKLAEESVHAFNGVVDKYIGDCIMAYWIDSDESGNSIIPAINTIFDMRQKLYSQSQQIFEEFGCEMDFSAGIEYGDVLLGSIGSATRQDYTVIGNAVNTASRIQSLASRGELLVSGNVADYIKEHIALTPIDETIYLKGMHNPLDLYRVNSPSENFRELHFNQHLSIQPNSITYTFHVCGCRGAVPVSGIRFSEFGGETSCYVIKKGHYALIIDCGTGLLNAKDLISDCDTIDILLTHVHYDHIIGLLYTAIFPKGAKIRMMGHFGSWIGTDTIPNFMDEPYWPTCIENIQYIDITLGTEIQLPKNISATFYRSFHQNNTCIIKLMLNGTKLCILSDIENPYYINPDITRNADIVLLDGTFDDTNLPNYEGSGHCSWQKSVKYAKEQNIKRLIITHHNPESEDRELSKKELEAKAIFQKTIFARKGDIYVIQ